MANDQIIQKLIEHDERFDEVKQDILASRTKY